LPSTGGLGGKEERRAGPGGRERGIKYEVDFTRALLI